MIRALRGDNIEEIMEDVVQRETRSSFRDISYREFLGAFHGNTSPTRILCEPKTFRYLIQKYLEWINDENLLRSAHGGSLTLAINGATFGVSGDAKWQVGKIYFREGSRTLGHLDILDRTPQADLGAVVTAALSTQAYEPDSDVPF